MAIEYNESRANRHLGEVLPAEYVRQQAQLTDQQNAEDKHSL